MTALLSFFDWHKLRICHLTLWTQLFVTKPENDRHLLSCNTQSRRLSKDSHNWLWAENEFPDKGSIRPFAHRPAGRPFLCHTPVRRLHQPRLTHQECTSVRKLSSLLTETQAKELQEPYLGRPRVIQFSILTGFTIPAPAQTLTLSLLKTIRQSVISSSYRLPGMQHPTKNLLDGPRCAGSGQGPVHLSLPQLLYSIRR